MPVYLGLPVRCHEAFRLFGLDFVLIRDLIMQKQNLSKNNYYMDCYFIDALNNFFTNSGMQFRVFYTDKGQCIVGYEIEQHSYNFRDVDEYIALLSDLKTKFALETEKYKSNFSSVTLEHMEDEEEVVCFPKPIVLLY
jgi:hypothetical protein